MTLKTPSHSDYVIFCDFKSPILKSVIAFNNSRINTIETKTILGHLNSKQVKVH